MIARLARVLGTGIRARLSGPRDAGISLTELTVTVMVTGLLAAAVATMFYNVALATNNANNSTQRTSVAGNIMDEAALVVRMAVNNPVSGSSDPDPAIVSATSTSLTVYTMISTSATNPAPQKITLRTDANGNVLEDVVTATSSSGYWVFSGSASTRTLGGPLVTPTGTDPLFVYLDANGAAVTPGSGGLTLTQRKSIRSIRITVQITDTPTTGSNNVVLVNTIAMTNLTAGVKTS